MKMNKARWWSLIVIVAIVALLVFLVLSSSAKKLQPVPSAEAPQPGYYTGGAVEFIVTAGGEITHFFLSDHSFLYCSVSWEQRDAYLVNNRYTLQGENAVDILYAAGGKFHVAYTLTRCGTRCAWFPKRGQYTTEWVSERSSAP